MRTHYQTAINILTTGFAFLLSQLCITPWQGDPLQESLPLPEDKVHFGRANSARWGTLKAHRIILYRNKKRKGKVSSIDFGSFRRSRFAPPPCGSKPDSHLFRFLPSPIKAPPSLSLSAPQRIWTEGTRSESRGRVATWNSEIRFALTGQSVVLSSYKERRICPL